MVNQRGDDKTPIQIYVTRGLKATSQAAAAERGETLTDVLNRALRDYVNYASIKPEPEDS